MIATHLSLIRSYIARSLCFCHIILTVYALIETKKGSFVFIIPIVAAFCFIIETIAYFFFKDKKPKSVALSCFSPMMFIYVITIVVSFWILELERIKRSKLDGDAIWAKVNHFYKFIQLSNNLFLCSIKDSITFVFCVGNISSCSIANNKFAYWYDYRFIVQDSCKHS
jgi:heme/copper-type cytochrome/quinol oxidase subunit 4